MKRILTELQHQFGGKSDAYRSQLARLTSGLSSSEEEKTLIQHDIDKLKHWQYIANHAP